MVVIPLRRWVPMGLLLWSCAAPTLPLPPPEYPSLALGSAEGLVALSSRGGAIPGAIVVVYNPSTAVPPSERVAGAEVDETGSWSCEIPAQTGDVLQISQQYNGDTSDTLRVQVRELR